MNDHGLTAENLLSTLPSALREDASVFALAEAAAELLAARREETGRLTLYPAIGRLDEAVLDTLAWDFKVDWWDGDYSLEEKRRTLQDSWKVHRLLGTKAAVETAISAIYPQTTVQEWFDYGGKPYHFRVNVNVSNEGLDKARLAQVLSRVRFYKNLRSHMGDVEYAVHPEKPAVIHAGTHAACCGMTVAAAVRIPKDVDLPHGTAPVHTGTAFQAAGAVLTGTVPVSPDRLRADYSSPYHMQAAAKAGTGPAGLAQTIFVEVKSNGII